MNEQEQNMNGQSKDAKDAKLEELIYHECLKINEWS